MADQFISVATFRQMCGRAGRTGFDMQGEAIIMLDNGSDKVDSRLREHCDRLLSTDLEPLKSSLHLGKSMM
jgi:replicative superfamily II helicase